MNELSHVNRSKYKKTIEYQTLKDLILTQYLDSYDYPCWLFVKQITSTLYGFFNKEGSDEIRKVLGLKENASIWPNLPTHCQDYLYDILNDAIEDDSLIGSDEDNNLFVRLGRVSIGHLWDKYHEQHPDCPLLN